MESTVRCAHWNSLAAALAVAALGFATAAVAVTMDTDAVKHRALMRAKVATSLTNGILGVQFDESDGRFTIVTGANHPSPGRQVLFPTGTSYITLRDATSQEMFVNCGSISPGLAGYTSADMCENGAPLIEAIGSTGFRATFTMINWKVVQEVQINGSTLGDTNVSQKVIVTNIGHGPRDFGLRYMWDWMIAGNDASLFRQRNPDGAFTSSFQTFANPAFQLFEEVDNIESPTFSVFGTVGGGPLSATTPDQVRYSPWGPSYSSAWDFANTGGNSDSSTAHYWGFTTPITLRPNQSATFVEYVTTQFSAVAPPVANVSMSATSLDFGDVTVGSHSSNKSVTLTSTGTAPYQINGFGSTALCLDGASICASGDFTCSTTCALAPNTYGTGQSCQVQASFGPNATGSQTKTVYICDNADGSPRSLTLTGNGVAVTEPPVAPITISPARYDFGSVLVGRTSDAHTFTVTNPNSTAASLRFATQGPFAIQSSSCPDSLPAGGVCALDVTFTPTQPDLASGALVVTRGTQPFTAPLFGTGFNEARADLPSSVSMGAFVVGGPALSRTIELRNVGTAALTISSITATDPFTATNDCPVNLLPQATCSIVIGFSTTHTGEFNGTLSVVSNSAGGTQVVVLSANALPTPVPAISVTPTAIGFGDRLFGTTSLPQRVTIENRGGADATLTGLNISPDFVITNTTCGTRLAPQASCVADVVTVPSRIGPISGKLLVNSNAAGSPHGVDLQATGCKPFVPSTGNRFGTQRSNCAP